MVLPGCLKMPAPFGARMIPFVTPRNGSHVIGVLWHHHEICFQKFTFYPCVVMSFFFYFSSKYDKFRIFPYLSMKIWNFNNSSKLSFSNINLYPFDDKQRYVQTRLPRQSHRMCFSPSAGVFFFLNRRLWLRELTFSNLYHTLKFSTSSDDSSTTTHFALKSCFNLNFDLV